jgi:hypothetical protein
MKLLYVTESVPNRDPMLGDGSSMIPFEVLRNIPGDVAVTLLTFAGPVDVPAEIRARCDAVHVMPIRSRAWATVLSVFGLTGLGKHQRSTAKAIAIAAELSDKHDATLIHGPHALFLANSVRGPLVLQTVDPWSVRAAMDTAIAGILRPAYRAREVLALLAERRLPSRARLLTVGAADALRWSEQLGRPVRSVPNGAEESVRDAVERSGPVACFVGSLNYGPNIDSANVLIKKIAPLVWQQVPEARFVLAGRRPEASVQALAGPRVEVLANVPSVLDIFHSADVAVFPDEHGVGIRNSVREALAAGLPVVATPVAAREQAPHPLLTVEPETAGFVDHVVRRLTAPVRHQPSPGGGPLRTWRTVADDYLDEVGSAIRSGGTGLPSGKSQA